MAKNVATNGMIAMFSNVDNRLFHSSETDRISEALKSAIRQIMVMILISATPRVANMLIADVVVKELTVLGMDDNIIDLFDLPRTSPIQLTFY